jgi:3',5'-cyclic-AMP phosphodiesterase
MPHRIIQITDCHLFADRRELRGIATWPRLEAVLAEIRDRFSDCECLVVTGDTAHDEIEETYRAFRESLGDLADKLLLIPGNHDNREAIEKVFPERCALTDGRLTFHHGLDDWQLIGLDSHIPGEVAGRIGRAQFTWTGRPFTTTQKIHTVVFVHHPPVPIQSRWLDEIGLEDGELLLELLEQFPNIKLVCCGHVHQESSTSTAGPVVVTTPAVGPQFRPRTDEMQLDPLPPALRVIDLADDGTWASQIVRVPVE